MKDFDEIYPDICEIWPDSDEMRPKMQNLFLGRRHGAGPVGESEEVCRTLKDSDTLVQHAATP